MVLLLFSCNSNTQQLKTDIVNPQIAYNLPQKGGVYEVNTETVIENGIVFPDKLLNPKTNQCENSIQFKFEVKDSKKYFYKIYYQNEQYKFLEENPLSAENFYGSWQDTIGFKEVTSTSVLDSFIIYGNPRFEKKYFGAPIADFFIDNEKIKAMENNILNAPDWKKSVEDKAKKNKFSFEEQLALDATWVLKDNRNKGNINHHWKRNPRMGNYSALLVVCTEDALKNIPAYIQRIDKTNEKGEFVNPYSYFLNGEGKNMDGISIYLDSSICKLSLSIRPGNGVYVDKSKLMNASQHEFKTDSSCGSNPILFKKALFEQYFSYENRDFVLNTIPVISDWTKNEYSAKDYEQNKLKYSNPSTRIHSWIRNVECPCENVKDTKDAVEIWNPPSNSMDKAAKLNVGVITRIGFTYGKITAKVKFPPLLNQSNVWNGITNAVWLITQDLSDWNNRRYSESGYTPKGNPKGDRIHTTPYTEIDFEIIKASPFWPHQYYKKNSDLSKKSEIYNGKNNDSIIVALTNWDLASKDPSTYKFPMQYIEHGAQTYEALRWDELYQALTIRTPSTNNELFNKDYYFYQIEWTPTEIIWRIGPSKDKLKEIGYMNEKNTSIPNNQMLMIINQEFHLAEWWPVPVYEQDYIPFLKNTNLGKIYEITIE